MWALIAIGVGVLLVLLCCCYCICKRCICKKRKGKDGKKGLKASLKPGLEFALKKENVSGVESTPGMPVAFTDSNQRACSLHSNFWFRSCKISDHKACVFSLMYNTFDFPFIGTLDLYNVFLLGDLNALMHLRKHFLGRFNQFFLTLFSFFFFID